MFFVRPVVMYVTHYPAMSLGRVRFIDHIWVVCQNKILLLERPNVLHLFKSHFKIALDGEAVVISSYEEFSARQHIEYFTIKIELIHLGISARGHCKISQKIHDVSFIDSFSVFLDDLTVHFIRISEWSMTIFDDVFMIKISQCWSDVNQTFRPAPFPIISFPK